MNVSRALDADVPSKPVRRRRGIRLQPDGSRIVFSARVAGREEPWSTNFDLYEVAGGWRRGATQPDGRQSRLGHAAGVPAAMATSPGWR